jgi:hypothetical protein
VKFTAPFLKSGNQVQFSAISHHSFAQHLDIVVLSCSEHTRALASIINFNITHNVEYNFTSTQRANSTSRKGLPMNKNIILKRKRQPQRTPQQEVVKMLNRLHGQLIQVHSALVTVHTSMTNCGCDKIKEVMSLEDFKTLRSIYQNFRAICVTFNPGLNTPQWPE